MQTVVSGMHWTDMMSARASKGRALAALQARLGVLPEQTAARSGTISTDLDLYDHGDLGFAMRNAHPGIHAAAGIHGTRQHRGPVSCARSRSCSGAHENKTERRGTARTGESEAVPRGCPPGY